MSTLQFSRWIALFGVLAGTMIALIVPVAVLMVGGDITPSAKLVIIILALLIGGCVAALSAVVGITIPTALVGAAVKIDEDGAHFGSMPDCCAPAEKTNRATDDPAGSDSQ